MKHLLATIVGMSPMPFGCESTWDEFVEWHVSLKTEKSPMPFGN